MKKTLMNLHICSMDKVGKELMLDIFIAYKLTYGFIQCSEDDAEQTYTLNYEKSDVCSWLSVSGTHWHDDLIECASDPYGLAMEYRMGAVRFNVNSNGSAFFDLFDQFNHKAAIKFMGDDIPERANDDYNESRMNSDFWKEFTNALASENEFDRILSKHYDSAEETASAIAPLLHINSKNLLMDALYSDKTEDTITLHFKAAPQGAKKLTVKAAFKKIYGDALKPLGFVYAKTKEPSFIRLINDDLIHIIGIKDMKNFVVPFAGIATMYRADLGLDRTYRDMSYRMPHISRFHLRTHTSEDEAADPRLWAKFNYSIGYPESVSHSIKASLNAVQRWIIPLFEQVKSLKDFPDYYSKIFVNFGFCSFPFYEKGYGDEPIQYLLPNLSENFEKYQRFMNDIFEQNAARIANEESPQTVAHLKWGDERTREDFEAVCRSVSEFLENAETRQQMLDELMRRKRDNLEKLHTYGVI